MHFLTHFGHAAQTAGGYNLVVRTGKLRLRRLLVSMMSFAPPRAGPVHRATSAIAKNDSARSSASPECRTGNGY